MALSADRNTSDVNKYCDVPSLGEQLPEAAHPILLERKGSVAIPRTAQAMVERVSNFCPLPGGRHWGSPP